MKRTTSNLNSYRKTCEQVMNRADSRCEVMIDGKRCGKYILNPEYINFAHTETRNGKSDEWINNPENIIYTCKEHHILEHTTGEKLIRCDYEEVNYIPDEQ